MCSFHHQAMMNSHTYHKSLSAFLGENHGAEEGGGTGTDQFPGHRNALEEPIQNGLNEIIGERLDDGGEGGADDDTDGHIQHVTAKSKLFEFQQKLFHNKISIPFKSVFFIIPQRIRFFNIFPNF